MALINCIECDHQISDKAPACVKCGAPVVLKKVINCFECNTVLDEGIKSCTYCGAIQSVVANDSINDTVEKKVINELQQKEEIKKEERTIIIKEIVKEKPKNSGFYSFLKFLIIIVILLAIAFVIFLNVADKDTKKKFFESFGAEDSEFVEDNAIETFLETTEVLARQKNNGVWIINGWVRNTHTAKTINSVEIRFNFTDGSSTETIYKTLRPEGIGQPFKIKIAGHENALYQNYEIIGAD